MQNTSETWKSLAAGNGTYVESRAIISNTEYSDIEPPVITRALMQNGLEVGNVVSAMCSFVLDTENAIPKSAEARIETRLVGSVNGEAVNSEWLPQGTFFISKRVRDPITGIRQFECYDALLKTNAVWAPASSTWPQQTEDILDEILLAIGLELDARTSITSYPISQPNAGTTMRDVLSVIAQHNGGNWIVTPNNKLRLVPIQDLSDVGEDIVEIESVVDEYYTGEIKEITGVRVVSEDGDSLIGDETGAVVSVTIPEMIAVDLAEELIGKTYRPFSYGNAGYDISAELGDYIQCEDAISVIYSEMITLGATMHGDISAPDLSEISDEYPYVGTSDKTLIAAKAYAVVVADAARDAAIDAAAAELADAVIDINSDIEDLQDQIDGNITTWFYAVNPTLSNPPANEWTTDTEKNNHLGDLYYNTENGYCWRFMLANGQYSWQRISDTDITTALANAQRAQDTADGKRRVFVVQPTPPYDVGDLWVQGTSGDIMRCSTAKATGAAYSQSDWVLASKYTDDTAVNTLNNALTQQEIFNRLTDNGAAQGLVLYDGQLYVNASYINAGFLSAARIKGDTLTLGGENNVNGTMRILDASGNEIGTWNKDGVNISKGSIFLTFDANGSYVALGAAAGNPLTSTYYFDGKEYRTYIYGNNIVETDGDNSTYLTADALAIARDEADGNKPFVQCVDNVEGKSSVLGADSLTTGTLNVRNAAQTRANLGITPANIGAPSTTGSGASGTWGISITGNAVTASSTPTVSASEVTNANIDTMYTTGLYQIKSLASGQALPVSVWACLLVLNYLTNGNNSRVMQICWHDNEGDSKAHYIRTCYDGTWTSWKRIALADGTGASGTWGISVTGNAANVTGTVEVGHGGTGATTAAAARTKLGITPANISALYTAHLNGVNLDNIVYNFLGTVWNFTGTGVSDFGSQCGTLICTDVDSFGTSGSRVRQVFMNFFGNDIWTRTRTDTTWSAWKCLAQNNANVGASISLTSTDTTAALLYNKLKGLELNYPASIRVVNESMQKLTGKSISGGYGTVVKTGVESGTLVLSFDICYVAGNYRHAFTTRVSQNTITPGAVYRYTGTAV